MSLLELEITVNKNKIKIIRFLDTITMNKYIQNFIKKNYSLTFDDFEIINYSALQSVGYENETKYIYQTDIREIIIRSYIVSII